MTRTVPDTEDPTAGVRFTVRWGSMTHRGYVRTRNEDAFLADPPVFLVADGMGGHDAGDAASSITVEECRAFTGSRWVDVDGLHAAVASADERIRHVPSSSEARPGTTLTGIGLSQQGGTPCWLVFNVGDSRTYRFTERGLEQISVDHSRVQELIDAGELPSDADVPFGRNVITRALGMGAQRPPTLDKWLLVAVPGDRMLLCSDGLTDVVPDDLISQALLRAADPETAAGQLVALALEAGGRDNITAVVVDALDVRGYGPASSAAESTPATTLIGGGQ